jgi:hypothetical protein
VKEWKGVQRTEPKAKKEEAQQEGQFVNRPLVAPPSMNIQVIPLEAPLQFPYFTQASVGQTAAHFGSLPSHSEHFAASMT